MLRSIDKKIRKCQEKKYHNRMLSAGMFGLLKGGDNHKLDVVHVMKTGWEIVNKTAIPRYFLLIKAFEI